MKFLVDSLPYYGEDCPRFWSKYEVCSEHNRHECEMLKEVKETHTT